MFGEKINGKCPVETTIKLLGGKYKSTILWAIRDGALRYHSRFGSGVEIGGVMIELNL